MFKWINAKTELPKDDDHIIMVTNWDDIYSGSGKVFNQKLSARDAGEMFESSYYTHWMLLPNPPSRDE